MSLHISAISGGSARTAPPTPFIIKALQAGFSLGGRIAPRTTSLIGYHLWHSPTRFKAPAREKEALGTATQTEHRIGKRQIISYRWGDGERRVLLVHGWSGRGTQLGSFIKPLLTQGYQVVSFDAPAHGLSSGKQTNIFEIADVILAMQEYYGEFDAIISHSFGGPCVATAMTRGLTAKSVVCISPPANVNGLVDKFTSTLNIDDPVAIDIKQRIENTYGTSIWETVSMENLASQFDTPALIIHDQDDNDVACAEGRRVASNWKNARFIETSGLGHRRILRDADCINTVVDFIA